GFIHVSAEARDASFDARDFKSTPTRNCAANGTGSIKEYASDRFQRSVRDKKIEPMRVKAGLVYQVNFAVGWIGDFDEGERLRWHFCVEPAFAQNFLCFWTLDS